MVDMSSPRRASLYEVVAIRSPSRAPIDWGPYADGEWWLIHEGKAEMPEDMRERAVNRAKQATRRWAARNNMRPHLRWRERGRLIWVRFEPKETE
jgi:hypothetical protein